MKKYRVLLSYTQDGMNDNKVSAASIAMTDGMLVFLDDKEDLIVGYSRNAWLEVYPVDED